MVVEGLRAKGLLPPEDEAEEPANKPLPLLNLEFTCDSYTIRVSGEASVASVNFAISALNVFKQTYFYEQPE